jgi:predicted ArsR family transcriptional regulator
MTKSTTKPASKRQQLTKLISRKSGATIDALQKQLAWQPHTIRAEISRLRKGGLEINCSPSAKGSLYQVQAAEVNA